MGYSHKCHWCSMSLVRAHKALFPWIAASSTSHDWNWSIFEVLAQMTPSFAHLPDPRDGKNSSSTGAPKAFCSDLPLCLILACGVRICALL